MGEVKAILLIKRESWEDFKLWIMKPAHINKVDLNIACVTKWKKASSVAFIEIDSIISPNWLSVESAIIFFISISILAEIDAMRVVRVPVISKVFVEIGEERISLLKRIRR